MAIFSVIFPRKINEKSCRCFLSVSYPGEFFCTMLNKEQKDRSRTNGTNVRISISSRILVDGFPGWENLPKQSDIACFKSHVIPIDFLAGPRRPSSPHVRKFTTKSTSCSFSSNRSIYWSTSYVITLLLLSEFRNYTVLCSDRL